MLEHFLDGLDDFLSALRQADLGDRFHLLDSIGANNILQPETRQDNLDVVGRQIAEGGLRLRVANWVRIERDLANLVASVVGRSGLQEQLGSSADQAGAGHNAPLLTKRAHGWAEIVVHSAVVVSVTERVTVLTAAIMRLQAVAVPRAISRDRVGALVRGVGIAMRGRRNELKAKIGILRAAGLHGAARSLSFHDLGLITVVILEDRLALGDLGQVRLDRVHIPATEMFRSRKSKKKKNLEGKQTRETPKENPRKTSEPRVRDRGLGNRDTGLSCHDTRANSGLDTSNIDSVESVVTSQEQVVEGRVLRVQAEPSLVCGSQHVELARIAVTKKYSFSKHSDRVRDCGKRTY